MNAHGQLLKQSVLSPSAAVELVRQHPDPKSLGWTYVVVLSVVALLMDMVRRSLFPGNYVVDPNSPPALAWFDSVWSVGIITAVFYALSYVFLRWFWRRLTEPAVDQPTIDAAIVVSFACALVFLIPQLLLMEFTANAGKLLQLLGWIVPVAAVLVITSQAFAYACNLSFAKALLLNVTSTVILFVAFLILMLLVIMAFAAVTGTPLGDMFGTVEEVEQ